MKNKSGVIIRKRTSLLMPLEFFEYKNSCDKINFYMKLEKIARKERFSAQNRISSFILKDLPVVKKILEELENKFKKA